MADQLLTDHLAAAGPATSAELAARTGTAERYVREWLEHHASGLLEVDDPAAGSLKRRYRLPAAHIPVPRRCQGSPRAGSPTTARST
jgi:hypothetical protein